MDYIYKAKAVIDNNLYLKSLDGKLYDYLKVDLYSTVDTFLHEDDMDIFAETIKSSIQDTTIHGIKHPKIITLRFKEYTGNYNWFLVLVRPLEVFIDGKEAIELEISSFEFFINMTEEFKKTTTEYALYLGLYNNIYINYDPDEELITTFRFMDGIKRPLSSDKLSDWVKKNEELFPDDKDSIEKFANNLTAMSNSFIVEFKTSEIFGSLVSLPCILSGQLAKIDTKNIIIACIRMFDHREPLKNNIDEDKVITTNAMKDQLVNLFNKRTIIEFAKKLIAQPNSSVYLAILDLDNFKQVNDNFGHLEGDKVLCEVADIIRTNINGVGYGGRIGGDEFMLVIDKVSHRENLRSVLRNIRTAIEILYKTKPRDYGVTCSIGASNCPKDVKNYDDLFKLSDRMLYLAKEKGKNRYVIYIPEIHGTLDAALPTTPPVILQKAINNDVRIAVIKMLIDDFLIKRVVTNDMMIKQFATTFAMDDIHIVYNDLKTVLRCHNGELTSDIRQVPVIPDIAELEKAFNNNGLIVVNGTYVLTVKFPNLFKFCEDNGIQSAIIYKLRDRKKNNGYIIFCKLNNRNMWTNEEIISCTTFGKCFEMSLYNQPE